jgi:hypothetical protein
LLAGLAHNALSAQATVLLLVVTMLVYVYLVVNQTLYVPNTMVYSVMVKVLAVLVPNVNAKPAGKVMHAKSNHVRMDVVDMVYVAPNAKSVYVCLDGLEMIAQSLYWPIRCFVCVFFVAGQKKKSPKKRTKEQRFVYFSCFCYASNIAQLQPQLQTTPRYACMAAKQKQQHTNIVV